MAEENDEPARIEIIGQNLQAGPGHWQPIRRDKISALNQDLPADVRESICQSATDILSRCINPQLMAQPPVTGLVLGYVQSGKTKSFTAVSALAADNDYRLIIIITGTSKPLLVQSRERLVSELRVNDNNVRRPWRHIPDPKIANSSHRAIRDILEEWHDPTVPPDEFRTVLITVMKNHTHLNHLIRVMEEIDLNEVPTLIIDDEGDQASLNNKIIRGEQSTTYDCLLRLKNTIPYHSFLQYTATPQAPLLINIVDVLSPDFAEIIEPGEGYVGGKDFFAGDANLVRTIPETEMQSDENELVYIPPTLITAMRLFYLGAAAELFNGNRATRSMMIHPSRETLPHGQYLRWIERAREEWLRILSGPNDSQEYIEFQNSFLEDYNDLNRTVDSLPSLENIFSRINHVVRRTNLIETNAVRGSTPTITWSDSNYWILVGGTSLDRGFTVEGLTITYMPRGRGVGNADTIQQRARFCGYRRSYLGYCRIFLANDVNEALTEYVEHEEDIREQLKIHRDSGRPLSEWRRQFFLNRHLRPTRNNILEDGFRRLPRRNQWIPIKGPATSLVALTNNRNVVDEFIRANEFIPFDGQDDRVNSRRNLVIQDIPLAEVHANLLTRYSVGILSIDLRDFTAVLRMIQRYLDEENNPNAVCTVFLMSEGGTIRRSYGEDGNENKIRELFQGQQFAQGANGEQVSTYPGDRALFIPQQLTVQLRYLDLQREGITVAEGVPHIAVHVPINIARDMVDQLQGF